MAGKGQTNTPCKEILDVESLFSGYWKGMGGLGEYRVEKKRKIEEHRERKEDREYGKEERDRKLPHGKKRRRERKEEIGDQLAWVESERERLGVGRVCLL